ncbi:MAG: DsbA family protein, partial [Bacillota bacterium]|nr:DsbA family protein [Bacillota bacterium]
LKNEFDIQEVWQGLEIHPETPPEGRDMSEEYPPQTRSQLYQQLNESGMNYGISFKRSTGYLANSRLALVLSEYAKKTASFDSVHPNIFKAYFEDGKDIGDREVLLHLAESVGLSREEVEQAWQDEALEQDLQEVATIASQEGTTAVPTFIINDKYRIVGAQPYQVFQETLKKIAEKG